MFISHERKMGGANMSLYDLVMEMKRRGHRVCVVVLFRGCPIDVRLREAGIETVSCFFGWWMQPNNWGVILRILFRFLHWMQWLSVIYLSNYVKKNKIDIIHSNSSVIDIGAQVAIKAGCRHVWHFREYGESDYNLEFMMGKKTSIKYVNDHSDRVIFISRALECAYSDIENKEVIYDGIEEGAYCNLRADKAGRSETGFLISGNISEGKNQMLVLEAVNRILKSEKPYQYKVYVAGAATALKESQMYEKKLKRFVSDNSILNVEFLGYVDDLKKLRNTVIDVEIIASRREAYGRVTIEAMASGNLVLAANSGSNPELIGNNEHGILFKDNDAIDLAERMMWCMDNRDKINDITESAWEYAYKTHRTRHNAGKVEDIYSSLVV